MADDPTTPTAPPGIPEADAAQQEVASQASSIPTPQPEVKAPVDPQNSKVQIYDVSGVSSPTPLLGSVNPEEVTTGVAGGQYSFPQGQQVPIVTPDNELGTIDASEAQDAFKNGYKFATPQDVRHITFTTPGQRALGAIEGVGRGIVGPVADALLIATGTDPNAIRARAEENPGDQTLAQLSGFALSLATNVGVAPLVGKAGEAVARMVGLEKAVQGTGEATKLISGGAKALEYGRNIASNIVQAGTANFLIQAGDEVSKRIQQDPDQTSDTVIAHLGLATAIGGVFGGGIGAVSPLWKAAFGDTTSQIVNDFKGQAKINLNNPDKVAAMTEELQAHHAAVTDLIDDAWGPKNLKAQDIAKAMPEMSPEISTQMQGFDNMLSSTIKKMEASPKLYPDRLVSKLQGDYEKFSKVFNDPAATPGDYYSAAQEAKQTLQSYSKFDKSIKPIDAEYDFVNDAKDMQNKLRVGLEDPDVWGKAGERQQAINSNYSALRPDLKAFEKKFMSDGVVDPAKIETYQKQIGTNKAARSQSIIKKFVDRSDNFSDAMAQTSRNLDLDTPFNRPSMPITRNALQDLTPGARIANYMSEKGIAMMSGRAVGAGIGAGLGSYVGMPELGAIIGTHVLGPFFETVLPAIARPVMDGASSSSGFKAAVDYGMSVVKGDAAISKATKNFFNSAYKTLPDHLMPKERDRQKIKDSLEEIQKNPQSLMKVSGAIGHYLPDHGTAVSTKIGTAAKYLQNQAPGQTQAAPLDSKNVTSKSQENEYDKTLDLAQQPLLILDKIKNGTVTAKDVQTVNALYPALHSRLQQQLTNELINHVNKGETVPYKTRIGMSLFMGQAMDSTMSPAGIIAAQQQFIPQQVTRQLQAQKKKLSSSAIGKMNKSYMTPEQSSEADKNRD